MDMKPVGLRSRVRQLLPLIAIIAFKSDWFILILIIEEVNHRSGSNSMVESQPSKLLVASSILVSRSKNSIKINPLEVLVAQYTMGFV